MCKTLFACVRVHYTMWIEKECGKNMKKILNSKNKSEKIKTTVMLDKTLKKLAQVYAIQHEITLQEVVEKSLTNMLIK
jgi:hypothetical protein